MKLFPKSAVGRSIVVAAIFLVGWMVWDEYQSMGRFFWPRSAMDRIENMAAILRRIQAPAKWCYPSSNPANIDIHMDFRRDAGKCLALIAPASVYKEDFPGEYIKRFYRAEIDDKFCEVTLSTFYNDDRLVGSDCYYGYFLKDKDTGVGMTDDKFG